MALVLLPAFVNAPALAETDTPMPPAVGRADIALYVEAFRAGARNNWRHAHRLARRASDPLGATILRWWDYSSPGSTASFAEIARFMDEYPDWPDRRLLQINAEAAMARGVSDAEVIAWYRWRDPISAPGRLRYADALLARGEDERAATLVRRAWVEGRFSSRELRETYRRYRSMLRPEDHIARLDRLVWANHARAARRMYRYVDEGHQHLAEARLMLRARQGGVDRAIERVPRELRNHPGLVYERLRWRRAKDRDDDARALLREPPRDLGPRPKLWWRERAILTRRALEDGQPRRAYALAAGHGQTAAATYSEAEWLAGWIALRFLDDARAAFSHFVNMHGAVTMPISRARGAYWAGRAAEALGDRDGAALWYEKAALHPGTFYGQLAVARTAARDAPLLGAAAPAAGGTTFDGHSLVAAVRFLTFLGREYLAEPFYHRLSEVAQSEADHASVSALALSLGQPDQAIRAAQQAARDGYVSIDRLFPLVDVPFARDNGDLDHALVLALIRQESRFDREARSGSGALGLMQLMPRTAQGVARSMGRSHSRKRLTSSATHNVALGSRYLHDLIERFDGSYLLAVAAYNGGPRNVARWIAANGDPRRDPDVDIIDWIEMIPLPETRNYVQRVLEGTQVYRWQLGRRPTASSLERDLARGVTQQTVALRCAAGDDATAPGHTSLPGLCRHSSGGAVLPADPPQPQRRPARRVAAPEAPVSDASETLPRPGDVRAAAARLAGHAVETPLLRSDALDERIGGRLLLKAEPLQRTGSFKFRGACNRLLQLDASDKAGGVVTYSSGNHAQAVAAAARLVGIPAVIVMPRDAPAVKIEGTRRHGAEVVLYERASEAREALGERIAAERGAVLVKPYDDAHVIAGQGTVGHEIVRQCDAIGCRPDAVVVPAGGGGLMAGTSLAIADAWPETHLHTAEPEGYDDHAMSFERGQRVGLSGPVPESFCDALFAPKPGALTFPINVERVRSGLVASDDEVGAAMRAAFLHLKLVVEPGGAVALAAVLAGRIATAGRTVVAVLSGGNVDLAVFRAVLNRDDASAAAT